MDDEDLKVMEGEFSPEMIAKAIFTQKPEEPCKHGILAYQEGGDQTYIFEILLIILLEGLDILTGGLKDTDMTDFSKTHITSLKPWFQSLCFDINVETFPVEDIESYKDYYCKMYINNGNSENIVKIFEKMPDKNYHFFINGPTMDMNRQKHYLKDVYGVFIQGETAYCISFQFFIPKNDTPANKLL